MISPGLSAHVASALQTKLVGLSGASRLLPSPAEMLSVNKQEVHLPVEEAEQDPRQVFVGLCGSGERVACSNMLCVDCARRQSRGLKQRRAERAAQASSRLHLKLAPVLRQDSVHFTSPALPSTADCWDRLRDKALVEAELGLREAILKPPHAYYDEYHSEVLKLFLPLAKVTMSRCRTMLQATELRNPGSESGWCRPLHVRVVGDVRDFFCWVTNVITNHGASQTSHGCTCLCWIVLP